MDLSRYPIERLTHFVACMIPGSVVLLLFDKAHPGAFIWFFKMGFLGYRSKLCLAIVGVFLIGYSISEIVNRTLSVIGRLIGLSLGKKPYRSPHTFEIAPWRDLRWRTLARKYLGADTPENTQLITEKTFEQRKQIIETFPDENFKRGELFTLIQEKLKSELDDHKWQLWYDHLHQTVLTLDPVLERRIAMSVNFALQVSALVVIACIPFVPTARTWWCITGSIIWTIFLVAESYNLVHNYVDPWSTLVPQINYLDKMTAEKK